VKIKYLNGRPAIKDPTLIAIVSDSSLNYDNEAIGEDIWGDLDTLAEEEYDSPVSCIWPACLLAGFNFISEDILSTMSRTPINAIASTKAELEKLIIDLTRLDFLFVYRNDMFEEINPEDVHKLPTSYLIEFIEYESS
jgi:hypothetical protein